MTPEVFHPPLVLAEFVTALKGVAPRLAREQIQRRMLHWVHHRVLTPLGQASPGSGRSREFSHETAYIAAVLLRLGRTEVDELRAVVRVVVTAIAGQGDTADLWHAAKDRLDSLHHGSVFAGFGIELDEADKPLAVRMGLARSPNGGGLDTPSFRLEGDSLTIVNLSDTFAAVRFP